MFDLKEVRNTDTNGGPHPDYCPHNRRQPAVNGDNAQAPILDQRVESSECFAMQRYLTLCGRFKRIQPGLEVIHDFGAALGIKSSLLRRPCFINDEHRIVAKFCTQLISDRSGIPTQISI